MKTWVLLIVIWGSQGIGISSIPGYSSLHLCSEAGRIAAKAYETPVNTACIPGPEIKK